MLSARRTCPARAYNKEDEGMGLCAGAYMGGRHPCIIMQNTAIGITVNTLATLIQFYQIPLPRTIQLSQRACDASPPVEMALHARPCSAN
ncbi:MAG: hypothetical protein R3D03_01610 [Geminicoccaceae bacterium]